MLAPVAFAIGCARPTSDTLLAKPAASSAGRLDGTNFAELQIDVEPGVPVVVRLDRVDFAPEIDLISSAGAALMHLAATDLPVGSEYVYWESASSDRIRVRVHSRQAGPTQTAQYRMTVFRVSPKVSPELRTAMSQTMRSVTADAYRDAADFWRSRAEPRLAAECDLEEAALRYRESAGWNAAMVTAARAAKTFESLGLLEHEADAHLVEGAAALEVAREAKVPAAGVAMFARAEAALASARKLYRQTHAAVGVAYALRYIAAGRYYRGDFAAAVQLNSEAAREFGAVGAVSERLSALGNVAAIRLTRGDYRGAAKEYATLIAQTAPAPNHGRVVMLQNGAVATGVVGETERALEWFSESLAIAQKLGLADLTTRALSGIGQSHVQLGQPTLAVPFLEEAAARARASGSAEQLAVALGFLADAYAVPSPTGAAAAARRESVRAAERSGSPFLRARSQIALAQDLLASGQYARASSAFADALALPVPSTHWLVARALVGRAQARRAVGDIALARQDLDRAIQLCEANDNREDYIAAMLERAALERGRGADAAALQAITQAIAAIDSVRTAARNPDNRISFAGRMQSAYRMRIDLLGEASMREQRGGNAEQAQTRALEALVAADNLRRYRLGSDILERARGPANEREIDTLYDTLESRRYRLETLAERGTTNSVATQALQREIAQLRSQLAILGYRGLDARRAQTASAVLPSLNSLQLALPLGSALFAYELGPARGWVWSVTRDHFDMRPLPGQARIDREVRRLLEQVRGLESIEDLTVQTHAIARLLGAGAEQTLAKFARLLIVSDGSLGALPWTLLAPAASVIQLSSVATLFSVRPPQRRDAASRARTALRVALFGDPIFGTDDARVRSRTAVDRAPQLRPLARLPGSTREVAAIAALAGPRAVLVATGEAATRAAVMNLEAGTIDVLHLATHASLDTAVPQLASIVMSRSDLQGRPLAGSLRIDDIRQLRAAPELVVLSACDTAAAPAVGSSSLMSLAVAFLKGDTRLVIASLWPVADASAAELMSQFYSGLLQEGLTPEASLLRAQRSMAASARWNAPFYWAGFMIVAAGL